MLSSSTTKLPWEASAGVAANTRISASARQITAFSSTFPPFSFHQCSGVLLDAGLSIVFQPVGTGSFYPIAAAPRAPCPLLMHNHRHRLLCSAKFCSLYIRQLTTAISDVLEQIKFNIFFNSASDFGRVNCPIEQGEYHPLISEQATHAQS